jgi:phage shock protein C
MKSRTRTHTDNPDLRESPRRELETFSDAEIDSLFSDEEASRKSSGIWNLPTIAGLSMVLVGVVYLFQILGIWRGFDVMAIAAMAPWLAGILIILVGLGVLSMDSKKKKKRVKTEVLERPSSRSRGETLGQKMQDMEGIIVGKMRKRKLTRSQNKKISGVCGGIAEYLGVDPTLVRIAFLIGLFASSGGFILAYFALSFIMPKEDKFELDDRITIIRDE